MNYRFFQSPCISNLYLKPKTTSKVRKLLTTYRNSSTYILLITDNCANEILQVHLKKMLEPRLSYKQKLYIREMNNGGMRYDGSIVDNGLMSP